jgi:hypothetical protein
MIRYTKVYNIGIAFAFLVNQDLPTKINQVEHIFSCIIQVYNNQNNTNDSQSIKESQKQRKQLNLKFTVTQRKW